MGDPRKIRGKYQGPRHPWNKARIEEEKELLHTYGLVNKTELWKVTSKLKTFKDNTKKLIAQRSAQSEKELDQIFARLRSIGLLGSEATADDVLGLDVRKLLDRRLQTIVAKKEMAHSPKQARQFILHGHVMIGERKVTVPGYFVPVSQESMITFVARSPIANADHPERPRPNVARVNAGAQGSAVKSEVAEAAEEAPAGHTKKAPEDAKPLEQQIEDETAAGLEVEEALETVEADAIAKTHEHPVAKKKAKEGHK